MPFSMPVDRRLPTLLFFLSAVIHHVRALGIDFQQPAAGATWPAGPITVQWTDAGGSPDMSDLTTYKLDLIVGGNSDDDSQVIQTLSTSSSLVSDGSIQAIIDASTAQSIQNGFYLKMTSKTKDNNQAINYSNRFTLINMKGTTENSALQGANAAAGSVSNVPEAVFRMIAPTMTTTTHTSTSTSTSMSSSTSSSVPASPSPSPSDDNGIGSISTVTLALIIMGAVLALIGLISIIVWILFFYRKIRRKRQATRPAKETHKDPTFLDNKTELAAYRSSRAVSTSKLPIEMNARRSRQELAADDKAVEAPASPMIYELEGDMSAWEAGAGRRSQAWEAV